MKSSKENLQVGMTGVRIKKAEAINQGLVLCQDLVQIKMRGSTS